jgi:hypothetical protein
MVELQADGTIDNFVGACVSHSGNEAEALAEEVPGLRVHAL